MSKKMSLMIPAFCAGAFMMAAAAPAFAYDGQTCVAPGNCWQPKPGFPQKIAGTKFDPKHDPKELAKQGDSIAAMEARNAKRVAAFKKSGKWVYEVDKIAN